MKRDRARKDGSAAQISSFFARGERKSSVFGAGSKKGGLSPGKYRVTCYPQISTNPDQIFRNNEIISDLLIRM